ncbi:MAG: PilN domain-containing protein [Comamonas sp.]
MMFINLLPHREEARRRRKTAFHATLGGAALAGAGLVALAGALYQARIGSQQARNAFLSARIAALDVQIKEIATLQADITALRARQDAVEGLQADRNQPVNLLNELVRQVPDGVFLSSLRQSGQSVTLAGQAQSNERISALLRNLGHNSPWLFQPQLGEIVASSIRVSGRDARRTAAFRVTVEIRRASEARAAAPGERP